MSQGVLGFKYEEEKHDSGMTGLAGLPVYLDLLHAMGLSELIGRYLQVKQRGWTDAQMVLSLMLLNIAGGDCVEDLGKVQKDEGFAGSCAAPKRRSSPALCTATTPVFPCPPSRLQSPAVPRFAPRRRAINTRSRPPPRGSLSASGAVRTTASRRLPRPFGFFFYCQDPERPRFARTHRVLAWYAVRPTAACHLLRRRQAAAGVLFSRRGDTCVTPRLDGRRESPSALLRTRHVSLSRPRPRDRLRGLQGAGRPLPPVETVRSGARD